jgi:hypothetical protein
MSITIPKLPKLEQIDFLVSRKFPNAKNIESAYRRPKPINSIMSNDTVKNRSIFAELEMRYGVIQEYRKELGANTAEEIESAYLEEQTKSIEEEKLKAEQEEKARWFHQPHANADFEFWSKAKHWTLDEAVGVAMRRPHQV